MATIGILAGTQAFAADDGLRLGIKGADDRRAVESVAWPWSAIGRINRSTGGYCTGSVIGPDKVLTAAHCLWHRRTQGWLPAAHLHFVAGYRRGTFIAHRRVASYEIAAGRSPRRGKPGKATDDWAILTLESPVSAITGVLPVSVFSPRAMTLMLRRGGVFQRAGYSGDRSQMLQRHFDCNVVGFSPDNTVLHHDCDATTGDSGSPLLMQLDKEYMVVGIHVGTATQNGVVLGVAVGGQRFRDWIAYGAVRPAARRHAARPTNMVPNAAQ